MTVFSKKSHEGYLFVDHRASPGLTEEQARAFGYDPFQCKEGKVFEASTFGCIHCGSHVVMNPKRTRARAYCNKCNQYICDWCDMARSDPNYVHTNVVQLQDLLNAGWGVSGGSMSNPLLTPPK